MAQTLAESMLWKEEEETEMCAHAKTDVRWKNS